MSKGLLFLSCITPLHNGGGTDAGLIDRPIIRERVTRYPFVQGSSLKGVIREHCANAWGETNGNAPKTLLAFGNSDSADSRNMGFLDFADANLLAFPIRSLYGGFVWASCPALLARLDRLFAEYATPLSGMGDLARANVRETEVWLGKASDARSPAPAAELSRAANLVHLEEFALTLRESTRVMRLAAALGKLIFSTAADASIMALFSKRFVLLHDDVFSHFMRHATEVQANIKINSATGTTVDGSLRYTEYLPQESILMAPLAARKPKSNTILPTAEALFTDVKGKLNKKRLQLGADQTVGKGVVRFIVANETDVRRAGA